MGPAGERSPDRRGRPAGSGPRKVHIEQEAGEGVLEVSGLPRDQTGLLDRDHGAGL
jgi:hypothetical protein